VNSTAVSNHLATRGIPAEKLAVIYNGIDTERFAPAASRGDLQQKLGLPTGVRLITLVANLRHAVKNVPMLLRTAKWVTAHHPDVHFVIAGEGELESGLKQQAREVGVGENVHFTGRCTDVPGLLAESYACVLTSASEGFSNSILEYMAAGKPVVATNVGGAAEAIIEGETGYIVEPDDDEAMAGRVMELLADKSTAETLGVAGRLRIQKNFSGAAQLTKTTELYEQLLGRD
jgi:glycosyltransferase involved in cell wall biosynthesis